MQEVPQPFVALETGSGSNVGSDRQRIMRVLIWSHHLLATSKRKDIIDWCLELSLWGISKPGYPGIIIVEGALNDVTEFLKRIKSLNWQALTVRHEEIEDVPASASVHATARLREPLERTFGFHKPRAVEVEKMGTVSEIMKTANLEDMFKSAMKLK
jgi:hypothetical protein